MILHDTVREVILAATSEKTQLAAGVCAGVVFVLCLVVHVITNEKSWCNLSSAIDVEKSKELENTNAILMEEKGKTVVYRPKPAADEAKTPTYSVEEIRKHNTKDDLWIIVHEQVYDITKFVDKHPGGMLPLLHLAGKDATDAMEAYHPAKVFKHMLPVYHIGACTDTTRLPWTDDFRALRQSLLREGLFETNMRFFYFHSLWNATLLAILLVFLFPAIRELLDLSVQTATYISAVFMGLYLQQMAFTGHDIGHNSVSHDRWKDTVYGTLCYQTMMGLSIGWWKRNHNTHHVICNSVDHDPDIQHWPVLCVSDKFFMHSSLQGIWSSYYQRYIGTLNLFTTKLLSFQHWLFYPLMAVARFNLYVQGWRHVLFETDVYVNRIGEAAALIFFAGWFSLLCFYGIPTGLGLTFLLVSHAVAGILHVQICQNHFSMPVFRGEAYTCTWDAEKTDDWWAMQLRTTLNVKCAPWMDWFHGGLQFQIVHHLFPRLPRHNLRCVVPRLKKICKLHGLPFYEPTFVQANIDMIETLYTTALQVSTMSNKDESKALHNLLWEGLCAHG